MNFGELRASFPCFYLLHMRVSWLFCSCAAQEGSIVDHLLDLPPSIQLEAQDIKAILQMISDDKEISGE